MAVKDLTVPDIGDFKDVDVIEVLVKPGDKINAEDALITLETDKASMDVPSSDAGTIKEVKVKVGDKVSQGSVIGTVETDAGAGEAAAPAAPAAAASPPAAAPQPAAAGGVEEVLVPDIGDFKDVDVIEVLVKPGATLKAEDPMITLESDKASMDVPAPKGGTVKEVKVKVGDKVSEGSLVLLLETEGGAPAAAPQSAAPPTAPQSAAPAAAPAATSAAGEIADFGRAHASPSVRRLAREQGVDLRKVAGSGRKSRITKDDVFSFLKGAPAAAAAAGAPTPAAMPAGTKGIEPIPAQDFAKFGPIETQPLSRIKKISGAHLHRVWVNLPMVTVAEDADITDTEALRKQLSEEYKKKEIRITMLSFLLKASAAALKAFPEFNASLDSAGENLILKKYCHIGVAVDTPQGLVVPVLQNVDKKSIVELSKEMGEISIKARDGKLKPQDMQGGCFTISSLGGIGGTGFTPIVNAPEVAILGVTRSKMQPVWDGKQFAPRLLLPLSLSFDHRVIDGAAGTRFLVYLASMVSDVRRLLL